ncbi:MAG: VIT1/CCC1 family protein [Enterococcaceae bacterium]|jgi:VIT1/CCC1 family predicted Fe2+/Mn2+ transporter|nr:VIT1/CCC1 family protein [Enterococcaceae bacterium]MCI1919056.1 VIT1/CCC1 family protein [Enterococcaceae bacterium]
MAEEKIPMSKLLSFQKDELNGHLVYQDLAKRIKDPKDSATVSQISKDELKHYNVWKGYTKQDVKPNQLMRFVFKIIAFVLGYTFTIKLMENSEAIGIKDYEELLGTYPEIQAVLDDEERHEDELLGMLDEERLKYVGAMILGLNDALVELTGTIAGLTFAMKDNRLVALSAIITGIAATLSMGASNYLAEKADGSEDPLKSSLYTGGTYLLAVVVLVLPYLLFPVHMYFAAFVTMLVVVVVLIAFFNFYIAIAKDQPFAKQFGQMAAISFSVMIISYLIGILAKQLLGVQL